MHRVLLKHNVHSPVSKKKKQLINEMFTGHEICQQKQFIRLLENNIKGN